MATNRFGYSDDFVLKNGKVGINTTEPQEKLDVVGGIVKGENLKVTGVSSFTTYEGFLEANHTINESITLTSGTNSSLSGEIIIGTGVTVTIANVGLGTTTVGVGTTTAANGKTTNTIDTDEIVSSGQGAIDSLKVYNTFTVPTGGTEDRPIKVKPGQLYYNVDFKTIEFWDGNNWRQVDNTTRSGRAVISHGYTGAFTYIQRYEYVNINTLGNSQDFGSMQSTLRDKQGCGSATRGLFGAGLAPGISDEIDYITIASQGNGVDFGNLFTPNGHNAACSSSTRGIWAGGYSGSPATFTNVIEYVQIDTLGDGLEFGDLTVGSAYLASCASATRGIFAGGTHPSAPASVVRTADVFTIASLGNAILFGDLTAKHQRPSGASNSTKGLIFSGRQDVPDISAITISSNGRAIHFGDLFAGGYAKFSAASQIRAIAGGGSVSGGNTNSIEYVTISTEGNGIDFGDLSYETSFLSACSDSHGGLGGF